MERAKDFFERFNKACRAERRIDQTADGGSSRIRWSDVMGRIVRSNKRERLLHDIISVDPNRTVYCRSASGNFTFKTEAEYYLGKFREKLEQNKTGYEGGVFIATYHPKDGFEHIHVVHDCRFGNSQCKCSILGAVTVKRRSVKRRKYSVDVGEEDWKRILEYLFFRPGGAGKDAILYLGDGRRCYSDIIPESDEQRARQGRNEGNEQSVGYLSCEDDGNSCWTRATDTTVARISSEGVQRSDDSSKRSRRQTDRIEERIVQFLSETLITPPSECIKLEQWLKDPVLRYIDAENKKFKLGIDLYKREILYKSMNDLYEHYKDKPCYFRSYNGKIMDRYHDVTDSAKRLEFYLLKQFGDDGALVYDFMVTLYKLLTHQSGKQNGMSFIGAPDAGKSYLVESICDLMMTYGTCSVMNKTNNFCFQSCIDVRLIVLDELNFDPHIYTDKLKLLLSGNPLCTSVKYKDDICIQRTPIIIMANQRCLPDTEAFKVRVKQYNWHKVDVSEYPGDNVDGVILNFFRRKIHPFGFVELWKQLKIWDMVFVSNEIKQ